MRHRSVIFNHLEIRLLLVLLLQSSSCALAAGPERVEVRRLPDGAIQPRVAIDSAGVIHLVSFKGEPGGGDLFYTRVEPVSGQSQDRSRGTSSLRINSQPGSAVALGSIRGARIALGRGGRLHVAWNGAAKATPANPIQGAPMLYTRSGSDPSPSSFEPQRNAMTRTYGLDGGGCVAADGSGNVYVAWHGRTDDDPASESGRRVWLARSRDDGATFAAEEPVSQHPAGACACCGMTALASGSGQVDLLFRAATGGTERGMVLLHSRDGGSSFSAHPVQSWRLNACPMSSAALVEGPGLSGTWAAWETSGQVYFARIDPAGGVAPPIAPPGDPHNRKHPALAVNDRGEVLLAWSEGTGWQRGGDLAWQRFDRAGLPQGEPARLDRGIPAWSFPAAAMRPDGGFVLFH